MSVIETYLEAMDFMRMRTLMSLDEIAKHPRAADILAYRPGPGRAHQAWQFMHIGITEELYGTERLFGRPSQYPELAPRFKGGSIADDNIPSIEQIRTVLADSREKLFAGLRSFSDSDLGVIPEAFKERGWALGRIIQVLAWHEAHHQGQIHCVLNQWKAEHGKPA